MERFYSATNALHSTSSVYLDGHVCRPQINVPQAFSPNGDGLNEWWCVISNNLTDFTLQIRTADNRKIYETSWSQSGTGTFSKYDFCWDGTVNPGTGISPPGTYLYYIRYSTKRECNIVRTGVLELVQ